MSDNSKESPTDVHIQNIYHTLTDIQVQIKEIASSVKKVDVHEEKLIQNVKDHDRFEKTFAGPKRVLYTVIAGVLVAGIIGTYSVLTTVPNITVEISAIALKEAIKETPQKK